MTEEPDAEAEILDTIRYACTNSECRAHGTTLEPDEVAENEATGARTCVYCGVAVEPVEES